MSHNEIAQVFGMDLVKRGPRDELEQEREELASRIAVRLKQGDDGWVLVISPEATFERDVLRSLVSGFTWGPDEAKAMAADLYKRGFQPGKGP